MMKFPAFLTLDLADALRPLRDLQIVRDPVLTEDEVEEIIIKLMNAMSVEDDVMYAFAAFAYDVEFQYFGPRYQTSKSRDYIQQRLQDCAQLVFRQLRELGCYVGGMFPYRCVKTKYMSSVTLEREVDQAFRFAI